MPEQRDTRGDELSQIGPMIAFEPRNPKVKERVIMRHAVGTQIELEIATEAAPRFVGREGGGGYE